MENILNDKIILDNFIQYNFTQIPMIIFEKLEKYSGIKSLSFLSETREEINYEKLDITAIAPKNQTILNWLKKNKERLVKLGFILLHNCDYGLVLTTLKGKLYPILDALSNLWQKEAYSEVKNDTEENIRKFYNKVVNDIKKEVNHYDDEMIRRMAQDVIRDNPIYLPIETIIEMKKINENLPYLVILYWSFTMPDKAKAEIRKADLYELKLIRRLKVINKKMDMQFFMMIFGMLMGIIFTILTVYTGFILGDKILGTAFGAATITLSLSYAFTLFKTSNSIEKDRDNYEKFKNRWKK